MRLIKLQENKSFTKFLYTNEKGYKRIENEINFDPSSEKIGYFIKQDFINQSITNIIIHFDDEIRIIDNIYIEIVDNVVIPILN